jgi:hypothetical protein
LVIGEGKNRNRIGRAQRQTLHQSTFINRHSSIDIHQSTFINRHSSIQWDRPVASSQAALRVVGRLIPAAPCSPSQSPEGEGEKITYGVNTYRLSLIEKLGDCPQVF